MRNNVLILGLFASFVSYVGCDSSSNQPTPPTVVTHKSDPSQLAQQLNGMVFACDSPAACHASVGLVLSKESATRVQFCTGFLVKENIVATNPGCISDSVKANPSSSCADKLAIRFQSRNSGYTSSKLDDIYACKRLIHVEESKQVFKPSYAYFEIERARLTPFKISKAGISDSQPVTIVRMSALSEHAVFFEKVNCEVRFNTLFNITSSTPLSPTAIAYGCRVFPGNLGAPILNMNSEVIGISHSSASNDYQSKLQSLLENYLVAIDLPKIEEIPHVQLTNFACTSDSVSGELSEGNTAACNLAKKKNAFNCTLFDEERIPVLGSDLANSWINKLPKNFVYQVKVEPVQLLTAEPICVVPQDGPIDVAVRESIQYRAKVSAPATNGYRLRLDGFEEFKNVNWRYKLHADKQDWIGTTQWIDDGSKIPTELKNASPSVQLPSCTDDQIKKGNTFSTSTKNADGSASEVASAKDLFRVSRAAVCPEG